MQRLLWSPLLPLNASGALLVISLLAAFFFIPLGVLFHLNDDVVYIFLSFLLCN